MDKLKKILNRETILYLIFGVATTVVNYIVFFLFYEMVLERQNSPLANAIEFVAAVIFAYVVNKVYVFESKSWSVDSLKREVPSFLAARIGSFLIEEVALIFCEDVLHLENIIVLQLGRTQFSGIFAAKIALSVIVVILNYVFCKWFIFHKPTKQK